MRLEECERLAEYAKNDTSLTDSLAIGNHIGTVDKYAEKIKAKLLFCVSVVADDPAEEEFLARLKTDIARCDAVLQVYASAATPAAQEKTE